MIDFISLYPRSLAKAQDEGDDVDELVEGVYRDRIDRAQFHKQFIQYGLLLYLMILKLQQIHFQSLLYSFFK